MNAILFTILVGAAILAVVITLIVLAEKIGVWLRELIKLALNLIAFYFSAYQISIGRDELNYLAVAVLLIACVDIYEIYKDYKDYIDAEKEKKKENEKENVKENKNEK